MKMVKSLLLGSAAGLVAVTAGQAADLPVKAKPVEYVKICSLYGAGFYYMPGTDLCLKIGGFVRAEETSGGTNGSLAWGPFNGNMNDRITNNLTVRARGYITADAREQSAYGTIRGYIAVGLNTNDLGTAASEAPGGTYANRAFVQWAGMTAGLSRSMFDGFNAAALNYRAGYLPTEDSGDGGWWIWAYTAQFGNGFSATFSSEVHRMNQIIDATNVGATAAVLAAAGQPAFFPANTAAFIGGGSIGVSAAGSGYGGWQIPDFVANLRVDQAWGSAQVMGAAHEVNATYYSASTAAACGVFVASATPSYETCGGPGVEWGWVVGAWTHINAPMFAQGDYLEVEANYTEGALKYLYNGEDSNMDHVSGATQGYGVAADCVYGGTIVSGTATSCHLTTGWNVDAGFEHYWTPQWHQSVAGGYINIKYDAAANAMLCSDAGNGNGLAGTAAVGAAGCNNNWSYWGVGTRLQWDVTKTFYLGVEVLYNQLETAHTSDGLIHGYGLLAPAAPIFVGNQSNWAFTIRAHRDFLP